MAAPAKRPVATATRKREEEDESPPGSPPPPLPAAESVAAWPNESLETLALTSGLAAAAAEALRSFAVRRTPCFFGFYAFFLLESVRVRVEGKTPSRPGSWTTR